MPYKLFYLLVDGGWNVWGAWGLCSVTCGDGSMSRARTCDNPSPAHGGNDCVGSNQQTTMCSSDQCPGILFK